jgi:hypothetical protein
VVGAAEAANPVAQHDRLHEEEDSVDQVGIETSLYDIAAQHQHVFPPAALSAVRMLWMMSPVRDVSSGRGGRLGDRCVSTNSGSDQRPPLLLARHSTFSFPSWRFEYMDLAGERGFEPLNSPNRQLTLDQPSRGEEILAPSRARSAHRCAVVHRG